MSFWTVKVGSIHVQSPRLLNCTACLTLQAIPQILWWYLVVISPTQDNELIL